MSNYCTCPNKVPRRCAGCGKCWWCGKEIDPTEAAERIQKVGKP